MRSTLLSISIYTTYESFCETIWGMVGNTNHGTKLFFDDLQFHVVGLFTYFPVTWEGWDVHDAVTSYDDGILYNIMVNDC